MALIIYYVERIKLNFWGLASNLKQVLVRLILILIAFNLTPTVKNLVWSVLCNTSYNEKK